MIYYFFKLIGRIALRVYFRRIFINGLENLPKNKPVLLAVNHPNSVIDALICGCLLPRQVHFLARGDAFKKGFVKWFLWQMRVIPIFRKSEGNLDKNEETFTRCNQLLSQNKVILIFPEGICVSEKRLRLPLKKGMARIAFGAVEEYEGLDLQIVPVGLNYTYFHKYRAEVMVQVGAPLAVQDYVAEYKTSPARAIKALTLNAETAMKEQNIIVEEPENEQLAENLLRLYRAQKQYASKWIIRSEERFNSEKRITELVNQADKAALDNLHKRIMYLQGYLKGFKLKIGHFNKQYRDTFGLWIMSLLMLPLSIIGRIFRLPPQKIAEHLRKTKVKEIEFDTTVLLLGGMFVSLGYLIVLTLITGLIGGWLAWSIYALIIISCFISVYHDEWLKRIYNGIQYRKARKTDKFRAAESQYAELIQKSEQVLKLKP